MLQVELVCSWFYAHQGCEYKIIFFSYDQVRGLAEEGMEGVWSGGLAIAIERKVVKVRYLEVCLFS